jgi:uncharacterized membrane protein
MESRYKLLGHPIHPMLVPFPLALLLTSVIFDVLSLLGAPEQWHEIAFWLLVAGLAFGLAAYIVGWLEYYKIPARTRAKQVALYHGVGNSGVLALFAFSAGIRADAPVTLDPLALVAALAGAAILGVTAWLGGELPYRLGVGVDQGANLDAPSSLSGRPASEGQAPKDA